MTDDKKNVLRLAKDGEGTCLDCEWGTCLFGGSKGAVCLHTEKKNINELTRCNEYSQPKGKQYYYAISYTCCGGFGADYFNGFRQHKTEPHLMIKESKSVMVRTSFMKWKNKETAFKWLQKIKDETKESFRQYECKVEKITWHDGCWRTVEYVKEIE